MEIKTTIRWTHCLKIREDYADAVLSGEKTFELRYNDRNYKKGDLIKFRVINKNQCDVPEHKLNGQEYEITYVLEGWEGLKDNVVALGIKRHRKETGLERIKAYPCDPKKNKDCKKTGCYERGGFCKLTLNPEYAKEERDEHNMR